MVEFYKLFGERFGIRKHAISNSTAYSSSNVSGAKSNQPRASSSKQHGKRKISDQREQNEGENGDEESYKRAKHDNEGQTDERRLACPYFKRNPRKYRKIHSCLGPGWVAIHRLK
jgi:hypothetical protein